MSSLVITINTAQSYTDFNKAGIRTENLVAIENLIKAYKAGMAIGAVYVSGSATDPVAASATATLTYASLANNVDTLVMFGVTLTCVTGTPAASDATTGQFKKQTDATVSAANLVATINAHTTLAKYVSATSALGVVTITLNQKGSEGNFMTLNTSAGTGIANIQWVGGTGGNESVPVQVR